MNSFFIRAHPRNPRFIPGTVNPNRRRTRRQGSETCGHGSKTLKHGAESLKHGAESCKHGEESSKHGAETLKHGAESCKHGAETLKHGAETFKHGAERSKHVFGPRPRAAGGVVSVARWRFLSDRGAATVDRAMLSNRKCSFTFFSSSCGS